MTETKLRSLASNKRMWAMLRDLSMQVNWYGQKLADYEWKDVISAGLKRQKVVPGIEGGFVVLGASTRVMTTAEMAGMIELIEMFGAQQGVKFTAPAYDEEHA